MQAPSSREHWSTRLSFILAAVGSAVGLGNIWKFPYITGVNGGGAFVAIYLACIAVVGLPLFMAELFIGQKAQANVVQSFEVTHRPRTPWRMVGWMGLLSAFLILSFYSVVGGWVLDFVFRSATLQFAGHSDEEIKGMLGTLFSNPLRQFFWHALFMGLTVAIVAQGIKSGLERWNRILMPGLFFLLAVLLVRAAFLPGMGQALRFLFVPSTENLTSAGVLEAVGHSFFTLSLGMGAMITYGSFLRSNQELTRTALSVAALDTVVALAAGTVIFAVVFSYGLEPGGGPALMFQTLPMLFAKLPGGSLISLAFFLLVAFAALSSAISLLEVVVAYWVENHRVARTPAVLTLGGIIYLLGIPSALSTNLFAEVKLLGHTFFDLADKLTSSLFLPLGGALISVYFGWVLGPKAVDEVLGPRYRLAGRLLMWTARVVTPVAVGIILVRGLREF